MLPASQRLRTDRDYHSVFRRSRLIRGRFLAIRSIPNNQPHHRFGFIISTRTAKRAVDRNRLKRQLRAAAAKLPQADPAHADIAITVQPASLTASYQQLAEELAHLISTHATPRHHSH